MIVYKYALPELDNRVLLPAEAKVLCVQSQAGQLMLWVQVSTLTMGWRPIPETRRFIVVNTGDEFAHNAVYISTVQRGALVSHIYEVPL